MVFSAHPVQINTGVRHDLTELSPSAADSVDKYGDDDNDSGDDLFVGIFDGHATEPGLKNGNHHYPKKCADHVATATHQTCP